MRIHRPKPPENDPGNKMGDTPRNEVCYNAFVGIYGSRLSRLIITNYFTTVSRGVTTVLFREAHAHISK